MVPSDDYHPDIINLRKYLKEFRPILFAGKPEPDFDDAKYQAIKAIVNEKGLPEDLISDYYWIVTRHLTSISNLKGLQDLADGSLAANQQIKDAFDLIRESRKKGWSLTFTVSASHKNQSKGDVTMGSHKQILIPIIKHLRQELKTMLFGRTDFEREAMHDSSRRINEYLKFKGLSVATMRYKIIGYLFLLAEMPVYARVSGKKVRLLLGQEFDDSSLIDTIKQLVRRAK